MFKCQLRSSILTLNLIKLKTVLLIETLGLHKICTER